MRGRPGAGKTLLLIPPLLAALTLLAPPPVQALQPLPPAKTGELLQRLREVKGGDEAGSPRLSAGGGDRCASRHLRQLRASLPAMDETYRQEALRLLGEGGGADKVAAGTVQAKAVIHKLPFWLETPNFSIEWGSELKNEDGTTPARDSDGNSIPDVVELWASYFERSYEGIRALGFTHAAALEGFRIRVYIGDSDPASTIDDIGNYYGFTSGDFPYVPGTQPAYIVVAPDFLTLARLSPNDESAKGEIHGTRGAMMVTAAHELHHVFQYIYASPAWAYASPADSIDWLLEGSSVWAEEKVFPFVNDYRQYFGERNGWQLYPELSATPADNRFYPSGSVEVSHIYGSGIFPAYVAEHLGGPATVARAWREIKAGATIGQAFSRAADAASGTRGRWTLEEIYLGFAAANATMDYEDGALYGAVPRRSRASAKAAPFPELFGSSYSEPTGIDRGGTTLRLASPLPTSNWGLAFVSRVSGAEGEYSLALATRDPLLAFTPPSGGKDTAVAAYLGPGPISWSFSTEASPGEPADTTPPTGTSGLTLDPAPEGFVSRWTRAGDDDRVAGYVVQWRSASDPEWRSRTILGGLTSARVGGLPPATYHEVRVFAYDRAGNLGTPSENGMVRTGPAIPRPPPFSKDSPIPPGMSQPADREVAEGERLLLEVAATDRSGGPATVALSPLPRGATYADSALEWTPDHDQAGLYLLTATATDYQNNSSTAHFTVTVTNSNRPPFIEVNPLTTREGTQAETTFSTGDPDSGDRVTVRVKTPPSHGTLEITGPDSVLYRPDPSYAGDDVAVVAVTDQNGASAEGVLEISVVGDPPPPPPPAGKDSSSGGGAGCFVEVLER